jgi:lipopolysaccharide export system protein LptA
MRTLVLAAGILLVGSLIVVLAVGKWRRHFTLREVLKPLGADITQEANGFTFSHALGEHSQYKVHASKVVELKDGRRVLHDVMIELYGEDGSRVDRIQGSEFEYDKKGGTVKAAGAVEITLMKPGVAPAVAPTATPAKAVGDKPKGTLAAAAGNAASGEIHVQTSGLTYDLKSGIATTSQHVDFSMVQGSGSSIGATYDSQQGQLVLDQAVVLNTERNGDSVQIRASHGAFERKTDLCNLQQATAHYRGGDATAGAAKVLFRDDGSAARLDASQGFTLVTANGDHVASPTAAMNFNEHNQPQSGHLDGGVVMDSVRQQANLTRHLHQTAPSMKIEFTPQGELRHTHMEQGVEIHSDETTLAAGNSNGALRVSRTWRSPVADLEFRDAGHGQAEPASMHGTGGVVLTGESQRGNGAVEPSRLAADEVNGEFESGSRQIANRGASTLTSKTQLTSITGVGHASLQETTATGTIQTSTGDRLEVHFASPPPSANVEAKNAHGGTSQIQSASLDGHVVLTQQPGAKPGTQTPDAMRATGGRAVYDGAGQWMHLTLNPRVEEGGLQVTAEKIDVSHESGDAFAHGNVKATWIDSGTGRPAPGQPAPGNTGQPAMPERVAGGHGNVGLGEKGPAHVISEEAELNHASGETTFRKHARLWQQGNSVSAPVIVLNREKQTLVARSADSKEPVMAVLVAQSGPGIGPPAAKPSESESSRSSTPKPAAPSVIQVHGGDLKYSAAERKAVMRGGALGTVVAQTATATSISDQADLTLLPEGNHAGKEGGQGQVDRLVASGHVTVTSDGRRGTGDQLVFTSETGEYVLTGSAVAPPRMTDPARGVVTGEALIFHGFDKSVSVESGGRKTTTETTAPK